MSSPDSWNKIFVQKNPKCARCRNHGINIRLRGHKRYCENRNCECFKCSMTKKRQHIMASQTATRRAQEQDERRLLMVGEVEPPVHEPIVENQISINQLPVENTLVNSCEPEVYEPNTVENTVVPEINIQYPSSSTAVPQDFNQYNNNSDYYQSENSE